MRANVTDSPHVSVVKLYVTFGFLESCLKENIPPSMCYFCFVCLKCINIIKNAVVF